MHTPPDDEAPRPPGPPLHLRAWEALPWLANGRATPAQQALVAAHLPHCADCRAELAWQRQLCAALQDAPASDRAAGAAGAADEADAADWRGVAEVAGPAAEADRAEAGLRALLARIDDSPAAAPQRGGEGLPAPARSGRHLTTWLAAAVVAQAVGLGVLGLAWWGDEPAAGYQTLTAAPAAPAAPGAPAATLRVLPAPTLRLAEWQALLQAHGLQVAGGPNSAGAWALAPAPAGSGTGAGGAAPTLADTLAALRAHPGVRLAEPIDAPAPPR